MDRENPGRHESVCRGVLEGLGQVEKLLSAGHTDVEGAMASGTGLLAFSPCSVLQISMIDF